MLIELESVCGDQLIHGKYLDKNEIEKAMNKLLKKNFEQSFMTAFCARYGYEEVQYEDTVRVDYIIDLDTHLLIKPKYE